MNTDPAPAATLVSLFRQNRLTYHAALLNGGVLCIDPETRIPSNADKKNPASVVLATSIYDQIGSQVAGRLAGQSSGSKFERLTRDFIKDTFPLLPHLRPGKWAFPVTKQKVRKYEQFVHLTHLHDASKDDALLRASLGIGYFVAPDLVVTRELEPDSEINKDAVLVDAETATRASLRRSNHSGRKKLFLLHASISCKWTIRSDRVQNSRLEALNLIRNRKGRVPHIVVVTGEPLPSRLASIALGTGDIDCVYHFALPELIAAVNGLPYHDAQDMLSTLVDGNRLKDITDLPLDLAV